MIAGCDALLHADVSSSCKCRCVSHVRTSVSFFSLIFLRNLPSYQLSLIYAEQNCKDYSFRSASYNTATRTVRVWFGFTAPGTVALMQLMLHIQTHTHTPSVDPCNGKSPEPRACIHLPSHRSIFMYFLFLTTAPSTGAGLGRVFTNYQLQFARRKTIETFLSCCFCVAVWILLFFFVCVTRFRLSWCCSQIGKSFFNNRVEPGTGVPCPGMVPVLYR